MYKLQYTMETKISTNHFQVKLFISYLYFMNGGIERFTESFIVKFNYLLYRASSFEI